MASIGTLAGGGHLFFDAFAPLKLFDKRRAALYSEMDSIE